MVDGKKAGEVTPDPDEVSLRGVILSGAKRVKIERMYLVREW